MRKSRFGIGILTGLLILALMRLEAAAVRGVTISAVSSEYVSGTDQRRATNLVSGVGLFGGHHTASPQGNMWLSSPTTAGAYSNRFVTFDLGSVRTVNHLKLWNYNEVASGASIVTRRGIQAADISVAGGSWQGVTNSISTLNGTNSVTLTASETQQFYRLRK